MRWCEENRVDYVLGLAKNKRLTQDPGPGTARGQAGSSRRPASRPALFKDFTYQTRKSWSRERRVVGKAEHLAKGANPRFVVTSLSAERFDAQTLYEDVLLRPRRDGEPDQGAAAVLVRRPHQLPDDAGQPVAAVAVERGLRPAAGAAAVRSAGHAAGQGPLRHDPPEAAEDRGGGPRHRAAGLVLAGRELPVPAGLRASLREPPPLVSCQPRRNEHRLRRLRLHYTCLR